MKEANCEDEKQINGCGIKCGSYFRLCIDSCVGKRRYDGDCI